MVAFAVCLLIAAPYANAQEQPHRPAAEQLSPTGEPPLAGPEEEQRFTVSFTGAAVIAAGVAGFVAMLVLVALASRKREEDERKGKRPPL